MANSINSKLQNNIISQSALEAFATILSPLQGFSTSFNDEASRRGSTINVTTLSASLISLGLMPRKIPLTAPRKFL